jgi:hypothetical protein
MARYVKLFLVLTLLIIGVIACTAGKRNLDAELNQDSETWIYEVFGMDCPGCHGGLENLLMKNSAILSAEADWVNKKVTLRVRTGSDLSDSEVFDAIKRANFTPGKRIK